MQGTVKLAGGVLLLAFAAGCGQGAGLPATPTECASYAVRAVQRHVTVTALPVPCRGLGAAALGQAVKIAVTELSVPGDKSLRRHRAGVARAHLRYLIAAANQAAAAARRARAGHHRGAARARPARGIDIPPDLAALLAWLLAAGSGAVLLRKVLRGRLIKRHDAAVPQWPGGVIVAHAGLAIAGLAGWIGYMLSGQEALAWASVAVLLPVTGLGISTLLLGIPDSGSARRSRAPVLVIVAHGALATLTALLVLLGAVTALTAHG